MTIHAELTQIPVGRYIFQRLSQVNSLKSIFGVPGDFNLPLLEHLYDVPGLTWIGNCNELNAGYAADGYARVNHLGVVVTTYGVGELSTLNAISGAFAEHSPVLSIVGTSKLNQKIGNTTNVHHLITNKKTWNVQQDHYVYERLVEPFSIISESLDDSDLSSVQSKIDNVIETIFRESRPGYLFVPVDFSNVLIPVDPAKPLDLSFHDKNPNQSQKIVSKILDKIYKAKNFAVLADTLIRHRAVELNQFVEKNSIHRFSTIQGKSILNETDSSYFHGIFNGALSSRGTNDILKQFELVVHFGYNFNECNNYKNAKPELYVKDVIEVGKDFVRVDNEYYTDDDVNGYVIFDQIVQSFDASKLQPQPTLSSLSRPLNPISKPSAQITQSALVPIVEGALREDDVLVVEMCSFLFAIPDITLPKGSHFINQNFYGSIGYALPATLGASLAVKDSGSKRRVILIEGDGSSQMTIQELTSYIRYDINPTVLLLNNDGYSVERVIMGETRSYNDIAPGWDWTGLLKTFGDVKGCKSISTKVETNEQLIEELSNNHEEKLKFIEVILDRLDVGWRFHYLVGKTNVKIQ